MVKKRNGNSTNKILWLIIIFFIIAELIFSLVLINREWKNHITNANQIAKSEFRIVKLIMENYLQKRNYQAIGNFIKKWGKENERNVSIVKVIASNGFIIGEFIRENPSKSTIFLEEKIDYSYRGQAILRITWDLTPHLQEINNLVTWLIIFSIIFAIIFWYIVDQVFKRKKEALILEEKTLQLNEANSLLKREVNEKVKAQNSLEDKNQELKTANEELNAAMEELEATNEEFETQNNELVDSQHRLLQSQSELESSLKEKNILLQELHHRVKNNLQLISSLFSLQSDYIINEKDKEMFQDCQNRIKSMANIHEKLYQTKNMSKIDFGDYIKNISYELQRVYYKNTKNVKIISNLQNINVNINIAIPCGLIVNELLSNSLKYAFPNKDTGKITVTFKKENDKLYLEIKDNGVGLPEDFDIEYSNTLGLKLVRDLTNQINGELNIHKQDGLKFSIIFDSNEQ